MLLSSCRQKSISEECGACRGALLLLTSWRPDSLGDGSGLGRFAPHDGRSPSSRRKWAGGSFAALDEELAAEGGGSGSERGAALPRTVGRPREGQGREPGAALTLREG
ncbi:hypothetical protein GCM10010286_00010 [Streptomyces toxytricini]|nr:hypothetical protein GCM10010286_00010 [Streptomyces toxytricini]